MLSAPSSIAGIKRMLNKNVDREELMRAAELLIELMAGEEGREGHRAFVEKRRPEW